MARCQTPKETFEKRPCKQKDLSNSPTLSHIPDPIPTGMAEPAANMGKDDPPASIGYAELYDGPVECVCEIPVGSISRAHTTSFGGRYGNFPSRICNFTPLPAWCSRQGKRRDTRRKQGRPRSKAGCGSESQREKRNDRKAS